MSTEAYWKNILCGGIIKKTVDSLLMAIIVCGSRWGLTFRDMND